MFCPRSGLAHMRRSRTPPSPSLCLRPHIPLHSTRAAPTQVHVIQPAPAAAHQQVDVRSVEPWMFLLYRSSHYDLIYPYEQEWRQIMQSPE
jgi:hypothetical protein